MVRVAYSSVNYKDALAATGKGKILRRPSCIGGIDLSGTVVSSSDARFAKGDAVIAASDEYVGVAHDGGYAAVRAREGATGSRKLPQGMSLWDAMAFGTAGYTAGTRGRAHGAQRPQAGERAGDRHRRDRRRRLDRDRTCWRSSAITSSR